MGCRFIKKNLADVAEKTLPPKTAENVSIHLKSCRDCRDLVERFCRVWETLEKPERAQASPQFWFQLERRLRESERGKAGELSAAGLVPRLTSWAPALRPVATTAVLILGVLVGSYLGEILLWGGFGGSQQATRTEQAFEYYLGGLDDFPTGSVGELYITPGNNS
jgi:hypothetical protein